MFTTSAEYFRSYDSFLKRLTCLEFREVTRAVVKRENLVAFQTQAGIVVSRSDPWFGSEWAKLSREEQESAPAQYSYYYGFAGDAFFRSSGRMIEQVCFLPACPEHPRFSHPLVGSFIFGEIAVGRNGAPEYISWNIARKQDKLFADILLGRVIVSAEKQVRKLTIETSRGADRRLYYLCRALHYNDVDLFAALSAASILEQKQLLGMPVGIWIAKYVAWARPDFQSSVADMLSD